MADIYMVKHVADHLVTEYPQVFPDFEVAFAFIQDNVCPDLKSDQWLKSRVIHMLKGLAAAHLENLIKSELKQVRAIKNRSQGKVFYAAEQPHIYIKTTPQPPLQLVEVQAQ